MNYKDILAMAEAYKMVSFRGNKKMDPVDADELKGSHANRADKDIDNDGDADKSDEYLHKRRKAISKAVKNKGTEVEIQTQESVEIDEVSQETLRGYHAKAGADLQKKREKLDKGTLTSKDYKSGQNRVTGLNRSANKMEEAAKDHGNTTNGSPAGEGLSPSAKKELDRKTPMNPATDVEAVNTLNFKTFKDMTKKAAMRDGDSTIGDKTVVKLTKEEVELDEAKMTRGDIAKKVAGKLKPDADRYDQIAAIKQILSSSDQKILGTDREFIDDVLVILYNKHNFRVLRK